jgi:hypothetical protein
MTRFYEHEAPVLMLRPYQHAAPASEFFPVFGSYRLQTMQKLVIHSLALRASKFSDQVTGT